MIRFLDYGLALVWLTMGLYCKVLGFVPRHQEIVAEILGSSIAPLATVVIGVGEIVLAVWIATGIQRKLSALVQIALVLVMNLLEITLASKHLLWGPANFLFASLFCLVVYWNGFRLHPLKNDNRTE